MSDKLKPNSTCDFCSFKFPSEEACTGTTVQDRKECLNRYISKLVVIKQVELLKEISLKHGITTVKGRFPCNCDMCNFVNDKLASLENQLKEIK